MGNDNRVILEASGSKGAAGFAVGRVVTSRCGRDQGQLYVVVGTWDARHVLLSNGSTRRAENPKKKNVKHLTAREELLDGVGDGFIRATLARMGEGKSQTRAGEG